MLRRMFGVYGSGYGKPYQAIYGQRGNEATVITNMIIGIMVYQRAELKIVEQRPHIVWQL
jgi:hypothetical protein